MLYFTALCNLHRSRLTSLTRNPDAPLLEQEISKTCMQEAAKQISSMADDINKLNLGRHLPTMGVTVAVTAAAIHLDEVKGRIQADREAAYKGYYHCRQLMESMEDIYTAAKLAKDAMEMEWSFVEPREHSRWRTASDRPGASEKPTSASSLSGSRPICEGATTPPDEPAERSFHGVDLSGSSDETDKDTYVKLDLPTPDNQVGDARDWVDLLQGEDLGPFDDLMTLSGA